MDENGGTYDPHMPHNVSVGAPTFADILAQIWAMLVEIWGYTKDTFCAIKKDLTTPA